MTVEQLKDEGSTPNQLNEKACTIEISCSKAGEDGQMNVEMNWEGDATIVAYLLQDALKVIDQRIDEEYVGNKSPLKVIK